VCIAAALAATLVSARAANAQFMADLYPNFWTIQQPGQLSAVLFGGGFVSDKYATTQQGLQVEQSITPYVGVFARATGYQLWINQGFDNPLAPGSGHAARLNFGRFQGGVDFSIYPGSHLFISGGRDAGDSHAGVVEGDLSSWLFLHSMHPLNFSFSSMYDSENRVVSTAIDLQDMVLSTEKYMVILGGGGAMYQGGSLPSSQGQSGPDLGFYYRPWRLGFSAQAGYGTAHEYGQLSMYKQFSFSE